MQTIKNSTLVMLLLATLLMAGCKKETELENNENTETVGHQNPNPAQDTPLSEHFLPEFESVYQLHPNQDGSFYALAQGDLTDYLLSLDNNGYVQQRIDLGFRSRRCISNKGEYVVLLGNIGSVNSAPYEMYMQGCVAVYDKNLNHVASITIREIDYKVDLYSVVQDTHSPNVIYVGGLAVDSFYQQYPYLCTIQLSDGILTLVKSEVYTESERCRIVGMEEKTYEGQKDLILETVHYSVLDDPYNYKSCVSHIVKPNYFKAGFGWGSETWDIAIPGLDGYSYTGNNSIDSDENNIYFFGYCKDVENSTSSDEVHSGFIAAVDWHQGRLVWTKTIFLEKYFNCFYDGLLSDGYLYACGRHSGVRFLNTNKSFANGLMVKTNLSGELASYKTFGDPERNSALYHLVKDSKGNMVGVGYSGGNLGNDQTKWSGWFLKTDMSSTTTQKVLPDAKQDAVADMDAGSATVPMEDDRHGGGI